MINDYFFLDPSYVWNMPLDDIGDSTGTGHSGSVGVGDRVFTTVAAVAIGVGLLGAHQRQIIAGSDLALQEQGRAAAFQLTLSDDCNTIAQQIGFVHKVGGQYDRPAGLVFQQDVPDGPAGIRIHSGRRFVENYGPCGGKKKYGWKLGVNSSI